MEIGQGFLLWLGVAFSFTLFFSNIRNSCSLLCVEKTRTEYFKVIYDNTLGLRTSP